MALEASVASVVTIADTLSGNMKTGITVTDTVTITDSISRSLDTTEQAIVINDYMSAAAFSGFGQADPVRRLIEWKNNVVTYGNGREQRNQVWQRPRRSWPLNWTVLDLGGRDALIEFFNRVRGDLTPFLYYDEDDYQCSFLQCIIQAAGGETTTQLIKTYYPDHAGAWTENKKRIQSGTVTVKIDEATQVEDTDYVLDYGTGVIDWSAGAKGSLLAGEVVTAEYDFYYPVRFGVPSYKDITIGPNVYQGMQDLSLVEII
jgi:uncharacterized protein (TIGR02217 family)